MILKIEYSVEGWSLEVECHVQKIEIQCSGTESSQKEVLCRR